MPNRLKQYSEFKWLPEVVAGRAFDVGIERIVMIHYGINDICPSCENDVRRLKNVKTIL